MSQNDSPIAQTDWYRVALGSIGDAVIVTDALGRVSFMNSVAETLTGWSEAEALGQLLPSMFRVVHEQTRAPVDNPVIEVIARGVVVGLAHRTVLIARDGSELPIGDSAAPIRDSQGGLVGTVLVFRDVSERRLVERAMEDALAYAEGIVDSFREPLVVLDAGMRVRTANRSFYQTFQVAAGEIEGRLFFELANRQWDLPLLRERLADVLPANRPFNDFEVMHEVNGNGSRTMLLNARRLFRRGDGVEFILLGIEDVTSHRSAAYALGVSEARYRRLFETAQDGILIVDANSRKIVDANPYLLELLGCATGELTGKELWEIGLFHDIAASRVAFQTLQTEGYIRYDDLPLQTKDGRRIDVEFVSNVYYVDGSRVIQCNIRDVTARKRAEEGLQQAHDQLERRVEERTRELAQVNEALLAEVAEHGRAEAARQLLLQRLVAAQEEERHRIARELHDQMGQHLTAFSLGLKSIKDATPDPSPTRKRLQQLQDLAELMGKEVHRLALELRPTALDDLGLQTALVNYIEAWAESCGTEVDFQSTGLDKERLPPPLETVLYRVVQEALTNVVKHARAQRVSLILHRSAEQVSAVIEDDGCGFDTELGLRIGSRLGLLGMQERVALVGGTLTVESTLGRGTTVFARIPLIVPGKEDGHDQAPHISG